MAFEDNNDDIKYNHLVELNDSDYEIADDEPNIDGWEVKDGEGTIIGDVADMLFDPNTRKVRYMIVELDEDYYTGQNVDVVENDVIMDSDADVEDYERKVLIPIGIAELVEDDQEVYLPGVADLQIRALPMYVKNDLDPLTETSIRNIFEGGSEKPLVTSEDYNRDDFYAHEHFNDDKFYNRQPTEYTEGPIAENNNINKEDSEYNAEQRDKSFDLGKAPEKGNDGNPVI